MAIIKRWKWVGLIAVLIMLGSISQVQAITFSDISGHWAKDTIIDLANQGYIKGYTDNTFKPDNSMTRAEVLTILINSMEVKASSYTTNSFNDISKHWAKNIINEAVRQGIVVKSEYGSKFDPDRIIKRDETFAMMVRALGKTPGSGKSTFSDSANIEKSIYRYHIKTAYDLGLISGFNDGSFRPFESVTRAQACSLIIRFQDQQTTTPGISTGNISSIQVGGTTYSLLNTPVFFKIGNTEVLASNLNVTSGSLILNGAYAFPLNAAVGNPNIVINNNLYEVNSLSLSQQTLVATTNSVKLNKLIFAGFKYNPEFVNLYVGSSDSGYYLSDMEILDQYTVTIKGKTINLRTTSVAIAPSSDYYAINRIVMGNGDTTLELEETDPVIYSRTKLSDIEDIYVDDRPIDMTNLSRLDFVIDNSRYTLSELSIDASGNIKVDSKSYLPREITLIMRGEYYPLEDVEIYRQKIIFYCYKALTGSMVLIDNKYYDIEDVQIIMDKKTYDLDDVLVVSRNQMRIEGRQYKLDSNFSLRLNNRLYDIDEIDYDIDLDIVVIDTDDYTEIIDSANQPDSIVFYLDGSVLKRGMDSTVRIYVDGTWWYFDEVTIIDSTRLSVDNKSYRIIGSLVRIKTDRYEVIDTTWQGSNNQFRFYLEEY